MAKEAWGMRRKCLKCATAFYDFKKEPPKCPKCNTVFKLKNIEKKLKNSTDNIIEEIEVEEDFTAVNGLDMLGEDEDNLSKKEINEKIDNNIEEELQNIELELEEKTDLDLDESILQEEDDLEDVAKDIEESIDLHNEKDFKDE